MAEEVQISGSNTAGKIRNPLGVIGLTLITLGIYGIFWYYFTQKELAEMGRVRNTEELGTSPGTSVLAVTLGALIIVPPFVSIYNACKRLNAAEGLTGQQGMEAGLLFLLWLFISPIGLYIYQSNLNKVLQAQAGGAPAPPQVAPGATEQPAPPTPAPPPPPGPPAQGS
jgi:drug/metabolite transporter (DMT)-like permease